MGYRHYFYLVPKTEVERVRDLDFNSLCEYAKSCGAEIHNEEDGGGFYFNDDKFMSKKEVFEFGKLYFDDTAKRIYSKGHPLFSNNETQNKFSDYAPYVVGKEGLLEAIDIYKEKVLQYYESILDDSDEMVADVKQKIHRIRLFMLVNTDESKKWCVTDSWEYEHSIFNLAHILKSVDWDNYTLLFYGW